MKRLWSSDSLATDEDDRANNTIYTRESCVDGEKKRRLDVDQVNTLEKNFEVENKLEPERKLKLARELNLRPRQVAVWFQNRRARSKTKTLERDFGALKANFDGLKLSYDKLQRDNEALLEEIKELKSNLSEEEAIDPKSEETKIEKFSEDHHHVCYGLKDGSCDSQSSAILNEDTNCNNSPKSNSTVFSSKNINLKISSSSYSKANSASIDGDNNKGEAYDDYDCHNLFGHDHEDEWCTNLFGDDQAPALIHCLGIAL